MITGSTSKTNECFLGSGWTPVTDRIKSGSPWRKWGLEIMLPFLVYTSKKIAKVFGPFIRTPFYVAFWKCSNGFNSVSRIKPFQCGDILTDEYNKATYVQSILNIFICNFCFISIYDHRPVYDAFYSLFWPDRGHAKNTSKKSNFKRTDFSLIYRVIKVEQTIDNDIKMNNSTIFFLIELTE